jgi:Domain of unknown function (DUF4434)
MEVSKAGGIGGLIAGAVTLPIFGGSGIGLATGCATSGKRCGAILRILGVLCLAPLAAAQLQPPSGSGFIRIQVWPGTASLGPGQTQQFVAKFAGITNTGVRWSISPNIGMIAASGLYTAPAKIRGGAPVTITATSEASLSITSTATVSFYSPETEADYPLLGSFLTFNRNMPSSLWSQDLEWMRLAGMSTIVILSVGSLKPDNTQPSGYSLVGMLYPSAQGDPRDRNAADRLEMILSLADERGMRVYLGSLQLVGVWESGLHSAGLRDYNRRVAEEVLRKYGHHPSLAGWYFTQEIWLNWVKYYGPQYEGTWLLQTFVQDMEELDPTKPVCTTVVFKKSADRTMPGLTPSEVEWVATDFLAAARLPILLPQDGAGAQAGAPPVSELPAYFQAFKNAARRAGAGTVLWSLVETFTAVPNENQDRFPGASAARIQAQVDAVRPYVSGYISWIFGNDMSPRAVYYPVEASELYRDYLWRFRPSTVPRTIALRPRFYFSWPEPPALQRDWDSKLGNRTGGGYNDSALADWAGFREADTGGTVRVVADVGTPRQIRSVRALSLSLNAAGIFHPRRMLVEASFDGVNFWSVGDLIIRKEDTRDFTVGWSEIGFETTARYVRFTFAHQASLYLSELEVIGVRDEPL